MADLKITYKNIKDLIPYINNARTHDDKQVNQIASSIKEFGFNNPILLDGENGVIAGHGRLLAAQKLKIEKVPCVELSHLSELQKKAYILADNKIALNSEWDNDLLKLELEALNIDDFDFNSIGFDDDEISEFLTDEKDTENNNDADDLIPEPKPDPISKQGDLWILGEHKLLCGDSTCVDNLNRLVEGVQVDLYLTDPPYNIAYEGKAKEALTIKNDCMADDEFREFLKKSFSAADSILKPGGVFYIWYASMEAYNFFGACKEIGWQIRQNLIWNKNSFCFGRQDYQWKHEPCLYGWKDGASHSWYSDRKQSTVIDCDNPHKSVEHPTMKPLELFSYLMKNSTKKGDSVFDGFGGSGTTLIVAEQLKRKAFLIELDPIYVDVIIRRWQDFTGLDAIREDGITYNSLIK